MKKEDTRWMLLWKFCVDELGMEMSDDRTGEEDVQHFVKKVVDEHMATYFIKPSDSNGE